MVAGGSARSGQLSGCQWAKIVAGKTCIPNYKKYVPDIMRLKKPREKSAKPAELAKQIFGDRKFEGSSDRRRNHDDEMGHRATHDF
jgi:hypothetical protein